MNGLKKSHHITHFNKAKTMTIKSVSLFYKFENSDKEYHIQLEESNGGFVVNFQYGRVGNALQTGTKTTSPVSLLEADKIYAALLKRQLGKGYSEGDKKNDFSGGDFSQKKEVYILPQLLNTIEDVDAYINDDNYVAQEKFDGNRKMVIADGKIKGLNKKGIETTLPNSVITSVLNKCILDGELIENKLFVFDLLSLDGKDFKQLTCKERITALETLKFGKGIEVVYTAYTTAEKRKLYEKLKKENKEGIVFKRKDSPYTHGRPASGGNQFKHKFYKTATFIVSSLTKGKRSVGLELISEGVRVFMGKVTVPPNHEVPSIDSFVEVRYLYCFPNGGSIFQPIFLNKRDDCDLTDVSISQMVYKAEL